MGKVKKFGASSIIRVNTINSFIKLILGMTWYICTCFRKVSLSNCIELDFKEIS